MRKKAKKSHWTIYSPPRPPHKPTKPQKSYTVRRTETLDQTLQKNTKLSTITLPEGISLGDLEILESDGCYDDAYFILGYSVDIVEENKSYDRMLKDYEKQSEKYKIDYSNWEIDKAEWEIWKAEQEKKLLEKQIKDAETLLKKHKRM